VTAQDILTRASRALEAAADRARTRDAEILRQRDAALAALPRNGRPAAQARPAPKPPPSFEEQERAIAEKLAAAERDAEAKARASEDDALAKWQAADADAYAKYMRAVDDARSGYVALIDTLQNAIHTMSAADQARFIRDRALTAAENEYRAAKTADYDAYVRASAAAREQAIEAIDAARQNAEEARRELAAARGIDADIAGGRTGRADGALAAAIVGAFDDQLARSKADAGRDSAEIIARMREELDRAIV
jgi:hypothetical protein